jgi:hypothetical protein
LEQLCSVVFAVWGFCGCFVVVGFCFWLILDFNRGFIMLFCLMVVVFFRFEKV